MENFHPENTQTAAPSETDLPNFGNSSSWSLPQLGRFVRRLTVPVPNRPPINQLTPAPRVLMLSLVVHDRCLGIVTVTMHKTMNYELQGPVCGGTVFGVSARRSNVGIPIWTEV